MHPFNPEHPARRLILPNPAAEEAGVYTPGVLGSQVGVGIGTHRGKGILVAYENAVPPKMVPGREAGRGDETLALTIVIPAFNEGSRLKRSAVALIDAIADGVIDPWATELILVDDGSADDTSQQAVECLGPSFPLMRVLRLEENSGKGAAVRAGAGAAGAPVVVFMDADMSVHPAQIPLLLAAMADSDVVIGSRSLPGSVVRGATLHRKVMGRTFSLFVNGVTGLGLKDTQCGFKAFRTPVARLLFHLMTVERFAFDVDVLTLARLLGLRISELPVDWRSAPNSTVRPFRDAIAMARDVFRLNGRGERPSIPALVIGAAGRTNGVRHHAKLADSFPTLRSTDTIVPLPHDRALLLLPLCGSNTIAGVTHRLSMPSSNLSVENRLVSCAELAEMMPSGWTVGGPAEQGGERGITPGLRRRHDDRKARARQFCRSEVDSAFDLNA
jgi:dolichyl-phosphate beta-glucosyltransferase